MKMDLRGVWIYQFNPKRNGTPPGWDSGTQCPITLFPPRRKRKNPFPYDPLRIPCQYLAGGNLSLIVSNSHSLLKIFEIGSRYAKGFFFNL